MSESDLRQHLLSGTPVLLPEIEAGEPAANHNLRTVAASWLVEQVIRPSRTVDQPVVIHNAVIDGDLPLAYVDFRADLCLINCTLTGRADLSFTKFATSAEFHNCVTGHVRRRRKLDQIRVTGTAYFQGAQFHGSVRFDLARTDGGLDFGGEEYKPVSLSAPKTVFHKEARFIGATVQAYISLISVEFKDLAWFDGMTVNGDAQFEAVQFKPSAARSGRIHLFLWRSYCRPDYIQSRVFWNLCAL